MEPGSRIAHFEVLGLHGARGMGEVYRARDARLGRNVAIKVLPSDFAAHGVRDLLTARLSTLDDAKDELAALEQRLAKTRALKQGMMREPPTERTQLV